MESMNLTFFTIAYACEATAPCHDFVDCKGFCLGLHSIKASLKGNGRITSSLIPIAKIAKCDTADGWVWGLIPISKNGSSHYVSLDLLVNVTRMLLTITCTLTTLEIVISTNCGYYGESGIARECILSQCHSTLRAT